jgi:protein gp37
VKIKMASNSLIEWTDATWNPITGCTKVSDGCLHCYAERLTKRLVATSPQKYKNGFSLTLHKQELYLPKKWKKSRNIFVNSMSDTFHEDVPEQFILELFKIMNELPRHIFQVLTKRSKRLIEMNKKITWTENIWMGVSVEKSDCLCRIDDLKKTGAKTKFVSFEPLLENINLLALDDIDWVIVGGESGPKARPMEKSWVDTIFKESRKKKVPFFFKQWGGTNKKVNGRFYNSRTYDEYPKPVSRKKNNE